MGERAEETRAAAFVTLGCKVNQAESDLIAAEIAAAGAATAALGQAGIVVVNTCAVTGEAEAKSRKAVRRALAASGSEVVVVTGCLAALDPQGVAAIDPRVVVEPDKSSAADRIRALAGASGSTGGPTGRAASASATERRSRVQVKIQDGCDAMCAYCVVPMARGAPRSRPLLEIVAEVAGLAGQGVSEVVLTGINIGRYADARAGLPEVVRRVTATGVARVRISSIEPQDVTSGLLEAVRTSGRVVPHFHVPLQSGCDRTLRDMGRRYDTATYADVLERIRESVPGAAVTTDVLVGFPGERDEDFAETMAFVRACGFARLHVFRYSPRPGTAAALRSDQVPAATRAERAALMRDLGAELHALWIERRIGERAEVLVERVAEGRAWGTSEDYLSVAFEHPADRPPRRGDLVDVVLTGRIGDQVEGRLAPGGPVRATR